MADIATEGAKPFDNDAFARLFDGFDRFDEAEERRQIDLVKFVLDRVGLAVMRAMATGSAATIEAPDPETARLLRLALSETSERRPTDKLLRVVTETATRKGA